MRIAESSGARLQAKSGRLGSSMGINSVMQDNCCYPLPTNFIYGLCRRVKNEYVETILKDIIEDTCIQIAETETEMNGPSKGYQGNQRRMSKLLLDLNNSKFSCSSYSV